MGAGASKWGDPVGVVGFDLGFTARKRSRKAGADDLFGFFWFELAARAAKSDGDGFECAGGRK